MNRRDFMKGIVVTVASGALVNALGATRRKSLDSAWKLVFFVESSNGTNPAAFKENAVGALGIAQITRIVVRDVNRILKQPVFSYNDRLDWDASRYMFNVYCTHYYPRGTVEEYCRLWHRGPSKRRQYDKHGDKYWTACRKT